ncbi:MAG: hypothetical protein HY074_15725 [Deltaproteobacteria bacterium]|nr:hypothetical protein [Deltaproteobacteria bacterium]
MLKNRWNYLLVASAVVFAQGCSGSKPTGDGGAPAAVQSAAAASPAQSAVVLSDLAFKNEAMALNQPRDLDAALASDHGCGLGAAYSGISSGKDLIASVAAYCDILASQNVIVRSCTNAQKIAFRLSKDIRGLAKACSSTATPARRRTDTAALARTIISEGCWYRRELGLPAAERLR